MAVSFASRVSMYTIGIMARPTFIGMVSGLAFAWAYASATEYIVY